MLSARGLTTLRPRRPLVGNLRGRIFLTGRSFTLNGHPVKRETVNGGSLNGTSRFHFPTLKNATNQGGVNLNSGTNGGAQNQNRVSHFKTTRLFRLTLTRRHSLINSHRNFFLIINGGCPENVSLFRRVPRLLTRVRPRLRVRITRKFVRRGRHKPEHGNANGNSSLLLPTQ